MSAFHYGNIKVYFGPMQKPLPLPSTPPPSQGTLADDCLAWQSQAAPAKGQGMGGAEPAEEEGVPEG